MSQALSPVTFHGDTIFCVTIGNQPYTPAKPIVENLGLGWMNQYRKLTANRERWGIVMIAIPTASGDQQTLCIPVRKLPAFLASINPNKVHAELRPKIELYQAECDDALWNYWVQGRAERPILDEYPPSSVTLTASTTADRAPLRSMVNAWSKVSGQPHDALWPQVRAAFNLSNIKELPAEWIPDAIAWVQEKIDALPAPTLLTQQPKLTFYPVEHVVSAKEQQPGPVETSLLNLAEQLPELENMVERVRVFNNQLAGLTSGLFHEETNRILRGASSADYATRRDISGALYAQHVNMVNHAVFMTQWARSAVATGIAMAHAMRK